MDNKINFKLACDDLDILNMESMIFTTPKTEDARQKYKHNFLKYLADLFLKSICEIVRKINKFKKVYQELNNLTQNYEVDDFIQYTYKKKNTKKNKEIIKADLQIFYGIITQIIFGEKKKLEDIRYFGNYLIEMNNRSSTNILKTCINLYNKIGYVYNECLESPFVSFYNSRLISKYIKNYKLYMIKSTVSRKYYINGRDYFLNFIPHNESNKSDESNTLATNDLYSLKKNNFVIREPDDDKLNVGDWSSNMKIFSLTKLMIVQAFPRPSMPYKHLENLNENLNKNYHDIDLNEMVVVNFLGENFFRVVGEIIYKMNTYYNLKQKFPELNNLTQEYDFKNFYLILEPGHSCYIKEINNNDLQIFFGIITEMIFGEKKRLEDIQNIEEWNKELGKIEWNNNFSKHINILNMFSDELETPIDIIRERSILPKYIWDNKLFTIRHICGIRNPDFPRYLWNVKKYFLTQEVYFDESEIISILTKEIETKIHNDIEIDEKKLEEYKKILLVELYDSIIRDNNQSSIENLLYFPRYGRNYLLAENSFNQNKKK